MKLSPRNYTPKKHKCQYPFVKIRYVVKNTGKQPEKNGRFTKENSKKYRINFLQ